ncbi:MAG TPA: hypothetical protein VKR57_08130 [Terriglobales bacterium]|nr:hypothetical protein [Terriglobales bacterium]
MSRIHPVSRDTYFSHRSNAVFLREDEEENEEEDEDDETEEDGEDDGYSE